MSAARIDRQSGPQLVGQAGVVPLRRQRAHGDLMSDLAGRQLRLAPEPHLDGGRGVVEPALRP